MSNGDNRSISVGGSVTQSLLNTGDNNKLATHYDGSPPPPPETVNARAELAAIKELLAGLKAPERKKLDNALSDVDDETAKPSPDKQEAAGALERVAKYASAADDFSNHAEKIVPRLVALGSWLGTAGVPLLRMLGVPV